MIAERILERAIRTFVQRGTLELKLPDGQGIVGGDGTEPRVVARLTDEAAVRDLVRDPELKLGELFTDGRLVLETGTLLELLQVLLQHARGDRSLLPIQIPTKLRRLVRRWTETNSLRRSERNVAHHYDIDGRLYDLFLDADRQYSCAYFERPDMTLDEAQLVKKRHIAAKLAIDPGMSVLDIGCGWGGMLLYLSKVAGAGRMRGITLSREQLATAQRRALEQGVDPSSFAIEDYRQTTGTFDRIVSVGMFEHVGLQHYDEYFRAASRLLADDGVMLLHTIGRTGVPDYTNPWITKYIFPGGHLPTMSEMTPAIERAGLAVTDVEVLRLHYAETLRHWCERFMARREEAARLYDERFCRMWECYLSMSEAAFRWEDVVVFQLQVTRANDVLPLTRGYIAEREEALRQAEEQVAVARPSAA